MKGRGFMAAPRKRYPPDYKAGVALEACQEQRPLAQLSSEFGVSSERIYRWNNLQSDAKIVFGERKDKRSEEAITAPLFKEIGRLKIELDWM